jgi:thiamine pyrophosphate-dependent acetolactate synthase large subunit-like protein
LDVFFSARQTLGTLERLQQSGAPVEDYDIMARACAIHLIRVCAVRSDDLHAILLEAPEEVNPTTVEIKVFPVCFVDVIQSPKLTHPTGLGPELGGKRG